MVLQDRPVSDLDRSRRPRQGRLIEVDEASFRESFNRRSFTIQHHLVDHPLFTLPCLVELARRLPPESIEYNAGDLPISLDPALTPRNGLSVEDTIRRIEDHRSWMVLKYVEQDAQYRAVLHRCLDEIAEYSEPLWPGMFQREGFIFISSPGSTTPFHIDPEFNFLLQVRGTKYMNVFDPADRGLVSEEQVETFLAGGHRNLPYRPEFQSKACVTELQPGMGVHVPITAPHWVKNGDAVSISFSITFRTPGSVRRAAVYEANARLRRQGLRPAPPGTSALRDQVKYFGFRAWQRGQGLLARVK